MKILDTTVVIPNYNGLHYLAACLESLRQDAITPVIVVDNGSSDGSAAWLATRYPAVTVIALAENTGFCHAVNTGIRRAQTEYVILLNNDTIVRPGFTAALVAALKKDDRLFSVAAKMLVMKNPALIDSAGDFYNVLGWAYARGKGKDASLYRQETAIFAACAGAAIYRRRYLEELGFFDEAHFAYLEDLDLGYAARLRGYRNRFCPQAEVLHAGSAVSGSRYNAFKTDLSSRNNVYIIFKNMPLVQIVLNLPFLLLGFFIKFLFFGRKGLGLRYLRGLGRGLKLAFSEAGRRRKVRFRWKYLGNYVRVQGELYVNVFRRN